jgi:glucose-1-phosphate cytidylyltransferase
MKVVLFCGGLGMRLRDYSESIPKPMVQVGYRPILWHIMRYYAHFGHKDFILCLGYKADSIKQYFLKYDETISNDFVMSEGGRKVDLLGSDIQDWKITFVDTGLNANIGMRLKAVQAHLQGEEIFLANYSDGVSDLPLPEMIDYFRARDAVACFAGVAPTQSFHLVSVKDGGRVESIRHVKDVGMRINGGFFVLRSEIFDWMKEGEELVQEPFQRLAGREGCSPTPTTASGRAWIPSRTSSCSRTCTRAGRFHGRSGRCRPSPADSADAPKDTK